MGFLRKIQSIFNDLQGKPTFTEEEARELGKIRKDAIMKEARRQAEEDGRNMFKPKEKSERWTF